MAKNKTLMYVAGGAGLYLIYNYLKNKGSSNLDLPTTGPTSSPTSTPTNRPATSPAATTSLPVFMKAQNDYISKVKILQGLVKVKQDGIIGPLTIQALAKIGKVTTKVTALNIDAIILLVRKNLAPNPYLFLSQK